MCNKCLLNCQDILKPPLQTRERVNIKIETCNKHSKSTRILHQKELRVNIQNFRHATKPIFHLTARIRRGQKEIIPTMKGTSQCSGVQQSIFSMLRFRTSGMSAIFPQFRDRTRGKMARVEISTEECTLTTTQTSVIRHATKQFP